MVCLNVVEHVEDDLGALRNIFSALQPGGVAVILVPQDQKAYGTLDKVLGHYRRYSEAQLRGRMEEAGFQVERILHFNRVTRPGWRFNGQVLKRTSFSRFQLRHLRLAGAGVAQGGPVLPLAGGLGDRCRQGARRRRFAAQGVVPEAGGPAYRRVRYPGVVYNGVG